MIVPTVIYTEILLVLLFVVVRFGLKKSVFDFFFFHSIAFLNSREKPENYPMDLLIQLILRFVFRLQDPCRYFLVSE